MHLSASVFECSYFHVNGFHTLKFFINSLIREKTKLKEEIIARRQQKLLLRRSRQKYLEEAALREAELLQELDRLCLIFHVHDIFI